jgi:hypothetical protein
MENTNKSSRCVALQYNKLGLDDTGGWILSGHMEQVPPELSILLYLCPIES